MKREKSLSHFQAPGLNEPSQDEHICWYSQVGTRAGRAGSPWYPPAPGLLEKKWRSFVLPDSRGEGKKILGLLTVVLTPKRTSRLWELPGFEKPNAQSDFTR